MNPVDLLDQAETLSAEAVAILGDALLAHRETGDSLDDLLGLKGDGTPWSSARSRWALGRRRTLVQALARETGLTGWAAAQAVHITLKRRLRARDDPAGTAEQLADELLQLGRAAFVPSPSTLLAYLTE